MSKISVVINTLNEQKNLEKALQSVKWADEIIVCDMHSEDEGVNLAKKMGAKVVFHKRLSFVEPARNFAISKATGDWILILDPDEEIPSSLASKLRQMAGKLLEHNFIRIPRKNLIFDRWMKASMWWPDYNIRFFKKGTVTWSDKIHRPPQTLGQGLDLLAQEEYAIIHHHYTDISQFIERMDRYTKVQASELASDGVKFEWRDLIKKPLGEFLSRYFANRGFEDGLHGLALSFLQALSFLIVYLKLWEMEKFKQEEINLPDLKEQSKISGQEINYWFKYGNLSKNPFKKIFQKFGNKLS